MIMLSLQTHSHYFWSSHFGFYNRPFPSVFESIFEDDRRHACQFMSKSKQRKIRWRVPNSKKKVQKIFGLSISRVSVSINGCRIIYGNYSWVACWVKTKSSCFASDATCQAESSIWTNWLNDKNFCTWLLAKLMQTCFLHVIREIYRSVLQKKVQLMKGQFLAERVHCDVINKSRCNVFNCNYTLSCVSWRHVRLLKKIEPIWQEYST